MERDVAPQCNIGRAGLADDVSRISLPDGGLMAAANSWRGIQIYTVGHSTRSLDELVALLRAFDVAMVVDIRTIPRSRKNPQFNEDAFRLALRSRRLRYRHLPELGGLRRPRKDSPNAGWRNVSFRGYADYMLTEEFELGLLKLRTWSAETCVTLLCAEAVPWRCHRSLVADVLTARGAQVEHIVGSSRRASPHHITAFAKIEDLRVTYPADSSQESVRGGDTASRRTRFSSG